MFFFLVLFYVKATVILLILHYVSKKYVFFRYKNIRIYICLKVLLTLVVQRLIVLTTVYQTQQYFVLLRVKFLL